MTSTLQSGIFVRAGLIIPDAEVDMRATRAAGPGGQNVNKVSTRIELRYDLEATTVLSAEQKRRVYTHLKTRINRAGVLRVVSQKHRTRGQNAKAARERLAELLRAALHTQPKRKPTRPTTTSRTRRLSDKRRRASAKRNRQRPGPDD